MASASSVSAAVPGTLFASNLRLSSSGASPSSSTSSACPSHSPQSVGSVRLACLPARRTPFLYGSRIWLTSYPAHPRQHHLYVAQCAAQAEAKEVKDQQDINEGDSDYESSSDEENMGFVGEEAPASVASELLKKYKEALSKNDQAALSDVESKVLSIEKEKNALAKQVSSLTQEVSTTKDRILRLNADFDNYRKRSERDRISVGTNVKGDVVTSLLPMVDNFERAKTQIKIETDGEQRIDSSYQGIYKQFVEIMKGLGVSAVETVGKAFDPNVHDAIMREESTQFDEGVVIEEFRRGFILGDKLLRPAMVKVSAGPPASAAPPAQPSEEDGSANSEAVEGSKELSESEEKVAE